MAWKGSFRLFGVQASWSIRRAPRARAAREVSDIEGARLHLGPGPHWTKPDDGWITIDADSTRADVVLDLNAMDRLPFRSGSIAAIYGSHVFEHVGPWHAQRLFEECYRVLAPGATMRMVLPHVRRSIEAYVASDASYPLFVRRRERAKQLQGVDYTLFECLREDFISLSGQSDLLGPHALAHQNAWDFGALQAALARAGFRPEDVRERAFQVSGTTDFAFEGTYPSEANEHDRSLYVEAVRRPRGATKG